MKRTNWFDREFPLITDNGILPCIIERLDGTSARLSAKMEGLNKDVIPGANSVWSVKKEIGHLTDLEPLWYERARQIIGNEDHLIKADLTNRTTHETDHDEKTLSTLITAFNKQRQTFVRLLKELEDADLDKAAIHPRLGTPMKIVDLAYFVAEHDDHHLAQVTYLLLDR